MEMEIRVVPALGSRNRRSPVLRGHTQNVSDTGVCLLTDRLLQDGAFLRCGISLPYTHVVIPSLMQVRWARESGETQGRYMSGLQFLF